MKNIILITTLLIITACGSEDTDYYPKPMGYMRVDYPERVYSRYDEGCAYTFEIPEYFSIVSKDSFCNKKDINMTRFNATMYLTYIPVDTNLSALIERSRQFAYEHSQFADAIEETAMIDPLRKAYGLRYNIVGNAASPYQFYLTDSVNHFLRGSFSFNVAPNYDSIKPALDYIVEDLDRMIETVIWRSDSLK